MYCVQRRQDDLFLKTLEIEIRHTRNFYTYYQYQVKWFVNNGNQVNQV